MSNETKSGVSASAAAKIGFTVLGLVGLGMVMYAATALSGNAAMGAGFVGFIVAMASLAGLNGQKIS